MVKKGIIYETTNLVNGKKYRGQHRCYQACGGLTGMCRYLGSGMLLLQAIEKYGEDKFERRTLRECDIRWLNLYEELWVDEAWCKRSDTYNLVTGGNSADFISDETRERIAAPRRGMKLSDETRAKMSAGMKRQWADGTRKPRPKKPKPPKPPKPPRVKKTPRKNPSHGNNGKVRSPETRRKMSIAKKAMWAERKKNK